MIQPILSVVIPTYNRAKYLERCLESILSHQGDYYEVIVSDNASPDSTEEIIQKYLSDSRISYYRNEKNLGARENIYKATGYARGEYVFWLSDDDYLLPNALSKVIAVIEAHPSVGYIYSPVVTVDDRNGKLYSRRDDFDFDKLIDMGLGQLTIVMSSAWVFSRQVLKREFIDWKLWRNNIDNAYIMIILVGSIFLKHPAYYISDDLVMHTWFNQLYWDEFGSNTLAIRIRTKWDCLQCMKIVLSNQPKSSSTSSTGWLK